MPQQELKRHVFLTSDALAELIAHEDENWVPLCENYHKEKAYAEYMTEVEGLLCAGCTFCRECGHELNDTWCPMAECKLYLLDARAGIP